MTVSKLKIGQLIQLYSKSGKTYEGEVTTISTNHICLDDLHQKTRWIIRLSEIEATHIP